MEKIIQIYYKSKKQSNDHTAGLRIYHISPWLGEPHSLSKASINYQSSIGILSTFIWAEQRSWGCRSANCEDANFYFDLNVNVETYEILLSDLYFS